MKACLDGHSDGLGRCGRHEQQRNVRVHNQRELVLTSKHKRCPRTLSGPQELDLLKVYVLTVLLILVTDAVLLNLHLFSLIDSC